MRRLIDANAVIKDIDSYYHNSPFSHPGTTWLRGLELATGLLLKAPTVDAVEVIRCQNCQYSEPCKPYNKVWCPKMGRYMKKDGFCSEGVMKNA